MSDNTGSFGAAIGGSSALMEAMQRRGMDTSALQQMSPAAAGGNIPMPQAPSQLSVARAALPMEETNASPAPTTGPASEPRDPELSIAMEALGSFVKSSGQTRRDLAKGRMQGIV